MDRNLPEKQFPSPRGPSEVSGKVQVPLVQRGRRCSRQPGGGSGGMAARQRGWDGAPLRPLPPRPLVMTWRPPETY